MAFAMNDFYGLSVPGKIIYRNTFYENTLPSFADSGAGTQVHVKNMGFGFPDNYGVVDGPGPEAKVATPTTPPTPELYGLNKRGG